MTTGSASSILGGGSRPPTSIVNRFAAGGVSQASLLASGVGAITAGKKILSGALTATVYKELLAVSGAGVLKFLGVAGTDATSRTLGLQVVIDGVTVFDAASDAITAAGRGMLAVGFVGLETNVFTTSLDNIPFNSSLSVSVKSSLTETDKVFIETVYVTV